MCTRLVRAAWRSDSPHSGRPQPLCGHLQGRLRRHLHMTHHWMLPASTAHHSVRWIQEHLQEGQWRVEHHRHLPTLHLPCLGPGAEVPVDITTTVSVTLCHPVPFAGRSLCRYSYYGDFVSSGVDESCMFEPVGRQFPSYSFVVV